MKELKKLRSLKSGTKDHNDTIFRKSRIGKLLQKTCADANLPVFDSFTSGPGNSRHIFIDLTIKFIYKLLRTAFIICYPRLTTSLHVSIKNLLLFPNLFCPSYSSFVPYLSYLFSSSLHICLRERLFISL